MHTNPKSKSTAEIAEENERKKQRAKKISEGLKSITKEEFKERLIESFYEPPQEGNKLITIDGQKVTTLELLEFGDKKFASEIPIILANRDVHGKTMLHYAAEFGSCDKFKDVLSFTALVVEPDKSGRTPLHYAAKGGNVETCALLMDQGAKLQDKDENGDTALHYAAKHAPPEKFFDILLQRTDTARIEDIGKILITKNKEGKRPLDILAERADEQRIILQVANNIETILENKKIVKVSLWTKLKRVFRISREKNARQQAFVDTTRLLQNKAEKAKKGKGGSKDSSRDKKTEIFEQMRTILSNKSAAKPSTTSTTSTPTRAVESTRSRY
jgi:hypothetical protein